jgi:rhamnogalacturonyl hydrolase YesR
MKKSLSSITNIFAVFILASCGSGQESMDVLIKDRLDRSAQKYFLMAESVMNQPEVMPRSIDSNGEIVATKYSDWVSGYFPGTLWYLYEHNGDAQMLENARHYTARVENAKYIKSFHDIGLMLYCSFGNGYRITGDTTYRNILLTGAESLAGRFNPQTGCIQSWNARKDKGWQYPVIIDGMVCLELLFWASKESGDPKYRDMCILHADKTMENHYRPDYSSYHVVSYDTITGMPDKKNTHQGFADESAWARGQAWGLHGYTMMYRETKEQRYLTQAQHIAGFILNHPNLPADKVPYWDFNAPDIPNALRDASAAAIIASALVELSEYVDANTAKTYLDIAEIQLRTLSSPEYFAEKGTNENFILKHSVGHKPNGTEIDVPIIYADYYYVEALMRYRTNH